MGFIVSGAAAAAESTDLTEEVAVEGLLLHAAAITTKASTVIISFIEIHFIGRKTTPFLLLSKEQS